MALGAITGQIVDPHISTTGGTVPIAVGDVKMVVANIVGDSSYPTGGSALTPAQLGLTTVLAAQAELQVSAVTAPVATAATYLVGTGKFQVWQASGAEMTNATNLSTITFQIIAFGY